MKSKTVYFCTDCGNETPKWSGKCNACGAWNTLVEAPEKKTTAKRGGGAAGVISAGAIRLSEVDSRRENRFLTGLSEFDRVLGGGAVRGSLVLVGGAPGIGKSTLLLEISALLGSVETVLYVTGEESANQIKMRADRLGLNCENIYILSETDLEKIVDETNRISPTVLIVDSIQTLYSAEISSSPGSVSQVRDCTMALMQLTKQSENLTSFVVGHINKEGAIAGPKVLEHMVDCVLYFEGERSLNYRILRAAKNRFGSTNEIGVFEMTDGGLRGVDNPSETLLSGRPENAPGTCVTCVIEGSRPILAEIQALVTPSGFNSARRNANGIDYNRALLLLAVLEKRAGIKLSVCDAYVNVVGGLQLDEPASDLAAVLAISSSFRDAPIGGDVAAFGEIGLTGEVRSVGYANQRIAEVARLGFRRCLIPRAGRDKITAPANLEIIPVRNIREAVDAALR